MDDHIAIGNAQNLFFVENNVVTFLPTGQKILDKLKDLMQITLKKNGFTPVSSHKTSDPLVKCETYNNICRRLVIEEYRLPCKLFEITSMKNNNTQEGHVNNSLVNLDENTTLIGSIYCLPKIEALTIEFSNLLSILNLFGKATGLTFTYEFRHSTQVTEVSTMVLSHLGGILHSIDDMNDSYDFMSIVVHVYNEMMNQNYCIGHIKILTEDTGIFYQNNDKSDFESPFIIQFILINSFEKLFVPLLEQNKKLPFLLNHNQINIIPINETIDEKTFKYIQEVQKYFNMFSSNLDLRKGDFVAKINDSERYEYVFVVGKKEVETNTITYYYNNKTYIKKTPSEVRNMLIKEYFSFLE